MTFRTLRVPFNMESVFFVMCTIVFAAAMREKPIKPLKTMATAGKIREYQLENRESGKV